MGVDVTRKLFNVDEYYRLVDAGIGRGAGLALGVAGLLDPGSEGGASGAIGGVTVPCEVRGD